MDSKALGSYSANQIPIVDLHEITAGKIAALLSRNASRDLFDVHSLLTSADLNREYIRTAFVIYGAINRKDWREVSIEDISFDQRELYNKLVPVLGEDFYEESISDWGKRLVEECKSSLHIVLPFSEREREFLDRVLDYGEIEPSLLTNDQVLAERIKKHPALEWKALNVREYKRIKYVKKGGMFIYTEEIESNQELQRVLWACYQFWLKGQLPKEKRAICYKWVIGPYEKRFGTRFHQSKLRQLARLGFLEREEISRGGHRRYYKLVNPEIIAELLNKWHLH